MNCKISAVIPTRNRPDDLVKAVSSICRQVRIPDELLIIDQSPGEESRVRVATLMSEVAGIELVYVHDPAVSGLVAAKQLAVERSAGDIVCFLEDDVVLEPEFIQQIEVGFVAYPDMVGCCGIITNPLGQPPGYEWLFHLFHRGIFRDPRVGIYGRLEGDGHSFIPSDVLSGGLSAWRRGVFDAVPFDVANGFFMLEDMDFSTRVARHFGHRLYINPNARLEHHWSPVNREVLGPRQRRKIVEFIVFYKKRKTWGKARLALLWLLTGLLVEALAQSLRVQSSAPLTGYFTGLREGLTRRLQA